MSPRTTRALRSVGTGAIGALIVALTIWAHVIWVNGNDMGQGSNLDNGLGSRPGLVHSPLGLLLQTLWPSLILVLPLGILAAVSGPWPLRLFSALMFVSGWYWVADRVTNRLAQQAGAAMLPGEAYGQVFHVPLVTPAFMGLATLAYLVALSRLNRAPRP